MRNIIKPNWPAPKSIQAFTTTRHPGFSKDCYASYNLALHVGDNPEHVLKNRIQLINSLQWANEPLWLNQIHSCEIIAAEKFIDGLAVDGSYANNSQQICTIMTADCLPILLTNQQGNFVMALHAGWRGLANGILIKGITIAKQYGEDILVWLGPAISQQFYEVGTEVKEVFLSANPNFNQAFIPSNSGRWLLDLYFIARVQCNQLGVTQVYDNQLCTYENKDLFFSYRRDGRTGRMATCISII